MVVGKLHTVRCCLWIPLCTIAGQASAWGAIQPCLLLLRSSLFGQCCRLLKAGKQVLWHGEIERIFLFDGKGGVKKIKSEQADSVGYLLSGTDCSMQIR